MLTSRVLHKWDDLKQSQKSDTQWMKNLYSNKRNDTQKGHFCQLQCSTISLPKPVGDAWEMFSAPLHSSHNDENCPGPIKLLPLQCPRRVLPMSRLTNLTASTACSRSKSLTAPGLFRMPLFFSLKISLDYFRCGPAGLQIGGGDWTSDWEASIKMEQSWLSTW